MDFDYLVIGAGISGAAVAYELAPSGSVAVIEAETSPGYHSTGRSAALYTPNFGNAVVRRINQAGDAFFRAPPSGFCQRPLLTPRGALAVAAPGGEDALAAVLDLSSPGNAITEISAARACELAPLLRPERVAAATYEPGVMDIDVASLHQGYLKGIKQRGGEIFCDERIQRLERNGGRWQAIAGDTVVSGRVIINAAGAWADQVGRMAGAVSIGLVPKRRTAIIVDAPETIATHAMPIVDFTGNLGYLKPDAGKIMASPGDETPMEPQDVRPDEMDIAVLVDWLQNETYISVKRIAHSWAGLRSFVADQMPVVGFDATAPDFFWLAGQGGYGIMMAPTLGRTAAELITAGSLPPDLQDKGINASDLSPTRFNTHI